MGVSLERTHLPSHTQKEHGNLMQKTQKSKSAENYVRTMKTNISPPEGTAEAQAPALMDRDLQVCSVGGSD